VLNPEMAFLIACANPHFAEDHKMMLTGLLSDTLDWDAVIRNAQYHKVIPLLHRTLTTHFKKDVPAHVLARIAALFKSNSLHSLVVSASLINVIKLLQKHAIEVLPVKGPILAEKLYGSIAMRTYSDVDILVHQRDIEKVLTILMENEYTLHPEGIRRSTFLKFLKHYHHGRLIDNNGVLIELHWELSGFYVPAPMTLESLQTFLIKSTFNNCPILDLTDEINYIFFSLHSNKHCFTKLDYVCTIAGQIKNAPHLDWEMIFVLGKKFRMHKRILVANALVNNIFGPAIQIPQKYLPANNSFPARFADTIVANEFTDTSKAAKIHPLKMLIKYQALVMDRKSDALLFILRSLVIPDHDVWHTPNLSDALFPLYFLYKPYRAITMPFRKFKVR